MRFPARSLTKTLILLLTVFGWLGQSPAVEGECLDTLGTFDRGEVSSSDFSSDRAYLGSGTMLLVLDISNAAQPTLLGEVKLDFAPSGIAVVDDLAYVVGENLQVVDVSDPTAPTIVNTVSFNGSAREVASFPGFLLISMSNALRSYDLTNPEAPVFVDSLVFGDLTHTTSGHIEVVGNIAYVPTNPALELVDLTTPDELSLISSVDIQGASAIKTTGSLAVVVGDANEDFVILDVSNPAAPVTRSSLALVPEVEDVELIGDLAVLGARTRTNAGTGQLLTIDFSNPDVPSVSRIVNRPAGITDLFLDGSTLYTVQAKAGLRSNDASDPLNIQPLGAFVTPSVIGGVRRQGDHLFLAAGHGGIHVLDISDPSQPRAVASHLTAGEAYDLRLQGDTAFVANGSGGFLSLDISDPLHIQELDRRTDQDLTTAIDVQSGLAYLGDLFFGLRIVDVTSPASLVEVGQLPIGERAEQLVVDNSLLYLAAAHHGLRVLDVSDPTLPQSLSQHTMPGWSNRLSKSGDFIYINTNRFEDARVFDVSDPSQPDLTTIDDCSSSAVHFDGATGYLSCGVAVRVVRLSPSGSVSVQVTRQPGPNFTSIHKDGDRLYLGSTRIGLEILDLNGCDSLLADGFESGDLSAWSASVP